MAQSSDAPGSERESIASSYALYQKELSAFFTRHTRSPTAAEDLVQEVYERLLRYPAHEPVRDPVGYLFQIARNVLHDSYRSTRTERQRFLSCEPRTLERVAEGTSRLWIPEEGGVDLAAQEMEQVLSQLPRACRVALLRQRRDGWTYQQIATELGVSVRTVKDYIVKALNHFRLHYDLDTSEP